MFSTLFENFQPFSSNIKLSSANALNLEESKIRCLGKGQISNCLAFQDMMVTRGNQPSDSDADTVSNDPIHAKVKELLKATAKCKFIQTLPSLYQTIWILKNL